MQLVHYQLAILKVKIRKVYSVTDETAYLLLLRHYLHEQEIGKLKKTCYYLRGCYCDWKA